MPQLSPIPNLIAYDQLMARHRTLMKRAHQLMHQHDPDRNRLEITLQEADDAADSAARIRVNWTPHQWREARTQQRDLST